jgi:hypothetical protein
VARNGGNISYIKYSTIFLPMYDMCLISHLEVSSLFASSYYCYEFLHAEEIIGRQFEHSATRASVLERRSSEPANPLCRPFHFHGASAAAQNNNEHRGLLADGCWVDVAW